MLSKGIEKHMLVQISFVRQQEKGTLDWSACAESLKPRDH